MIPNPLLQIQKTVHQAVAEATDMDPARLCHLVASTGSVALGALLGNAWHVSAGSLSVITDPKPVDGGNPFQLEMDADSGMPDLEFHAWIVWVPPGIQPTVNDVLYLDLNSSFYSRWAEWVNIPWNRPDLEGQHPLIGSPGYLHGKYRVALSAKRGLADFLVTNHRQACLDCATRWWGLCADANFYSDDFRLALRQQIETIKEDVWPKQLKTA